MNSKVLNISRQLFLLGTGLYFFMFFAGIEHSMAQGTTEEENKEIIRSWIEARNTNNLDAALKLWPEAMHENLSKAFSGTTEAFPDVKIIADEMLVDGDKVVLRWTFKGTHKGTFQGIAATGKSIEWTGIDIYTVKNDKIVGINRASDMSAMMRQITGE